MPAVAGVSAPEVSPQAISAPQESDAGISDETFGGGRSESQLANATQGFIETVKQHADQVAVLDADNQLTKAQNTRLYDPSTGAMNTRGKNALGVKDSTLSALQNDASNISASLSSPAQRLAFQQRASSRMAEVSGLLDKHEGAQIIDLDKETTSNFQQDRQTYAVQQVSGLSSPDPQVSSQAAQQIEKAKNESMAATADFANRNGLQDSIPQLQLNAASKINLEVAKELVDSNQITAAQNYLDQNKSQFNGNDLIVASKLLRAGSVKVGGMQAADDIYSQYKNNESGAFDQLSQIEDPNKRLAAREYLRQSFIDQKRAKTDDETTQFKSLYNTLTQNGGDLRSIPTTQLEALEPKQQEYIKNIADTIQSGEDVTTDPSLNYKLIQMSKDPEEFNDFKKLNLDDPMYKANLSQKDLAKWQALQQKVYQDPEVKGLNTTAQIMEDNYAQAGLTLPKKSANRNDPDVVQYNSYLGQLGDEIQRTGNASRANVDKIAKDLLKQQVINKTGFFGGTISKPTFNVGPSDLNLETVPAATLQRVKDTLAQAGRDPNNQDNIRALYLQGARMGKW